MKENLLTALFVGWITIGAIAFVLILQHFKFEMIPDIICLSIFFGVIGLFNSIKVDEDESKIQFRHQVN